jgi:hypothetical protein
MASNTSCLSLDSFLSFLHKSAEQFPSRSVESEGEEKKVPTGSEQQFSCGKVFAEKKKRF